MKQPEALRLADALKNLEATGWGGDSFALTEYSEQQANLAAAELERLHEANQAMLSALRELVNGYGFAPGHSIEKARAAIAKGEAK